MLDLDFIRAQSDLDRTLISIWRRCWEHILRANAADGWSYDAGVSVPQSVKTCAEVLLA